MSPEKFFDTEKVKINFLDYGNTSSEPLVMLHGGAWCWEEYLSLIPPLAERWHPYALDSRGNGKSGWVPGQYRLEDFTEDTSAFVQHLKAPAVLVGHSIGGVVSLMVAARCPDKVKGVILEDIVLTLENYKGVIQSCREMFHLWLELKRLAQTEQDLALALADKFRDYPVTSQWTLYFARCLWQLDPTYFDALLYDFDGFAKGYEYKELISKIKCPMLFMRGERTLGAVMTDQEISWLKENSSNASFAQIRGVGHLLHMQDEGQAQVLNAMTRFLQNIPK